MCEPTPFPGHHWKRCTCEPDQRCPACQGLSSCSTCRGGEASLTTDCPQVSIYTVARNSDVDPDAFVNQIMSGNIDYTRDKGWHLTDPALDHAYRNGLV